MQHRFLGKMAVQQMESPSNLKEMAEEEKQKEPACSITRKSQFHKMKLFSHSKSATCLIKCLTK
jgi:hypothetical protein